MYNMAKIQKTDKSELENIAKSKFYNNLLGKYSCLILIGQKHLRGFLDMILIFFRFSMVL